MPANEAIYRRVFATGRIRSNKLTVRSRTCFSSLPFVALTVVRSAVYRGQRGSSTPLLSIAGRNNASYVKSLMWVFALMLGFWLMPSIPE